MTAPLAEALAKMPPHTQVAEAIRSALEYYPHIANQVAQVVYVDQVRRFGSAADATVTRLAVELWVAGR
jgi:hypothetical protein